MSRAIWPSILLLLAFFPFQKLLAARGVIPAEAERIAKADFEKSGWWLDGWVGGLGTRELSLPGWQQDVVNDPTCAGDVCNQVLKWRVNEGDHASGRYMSRKLDRSEVWATYRIYIPHRLQAYDLGDDQNDTNKFPGFYGGGEGSGAQHESTGTNGWSARGGWKITAQGSFEIGYYTYHLDRVHDRGDWMPWGVSLERDRWYLITQHVRVNTLGADQGNNDAVLEAWVDGVQVFSRSDLRFTDVPDFSNVDHYWLTFYFGGTSTAPEDVTIYLDQIAVYGMPQKPAAELGLPYPNPYAANGSNPLTLPVTISKTGPYVFRITDLSGREVYCTEPLLLETGEQEVVLRPTLLAAGMHLVYATFGGEFTGGSGAEHSQGQKIVVVQ